MNWRRPLQDPKIAWAKLGGPVMTLVVVAGIELFARAWIMGPQPRPLPALLGLSVVVAALLGGLRPALASAMLGWLYLFARVSPEDGRGPFLFVLGIAYPLVAILITLLQARLLSASRLAAERDAARTQTIELESLVAERTRALVAAQEAERLQTERITALYADLEAAYFELQELSRLKDEFLSTISHEFKTPLTAIKAAAWILEQRLEGELNEKQEGIVSIVITHAEHLHRMINDLLDLSKMESGELRYRYVDDDVVRLVREVTVSLSQLFAEKRLELALELEAETLHACIDHDRIRQVLLNMLSNAAKFTSPGGKVTLRLRATGDELRLEVEDTGIGIAAEHRETIFRKFYQVDGSSTRAAGGTGLGLAICRSIVEDGHRGRIWVESALSEGSTFIVSLPLARKSEPAVPSART